MYFTDVLGIELRDVAEWQEIDGKFRRLRNCLVHDNGEVDRRSHDYELLTEYIQADLHLRLVGKDKEFWIEPGYCEYMLHAVRNFLKALYPKLFEFIRQNEDDVAPQYVMSEDEWLSINHGRSIAVLYNPIPISDEDFKAEMQELEELAKRAKARSAVEKANKDAEPPVV
jgi:hypothetical protein